MKKFRFALLALGASVLTFAFTPSHNVAQFSTVYGFDLQGNLMDSASSEAELKAQLCPGVDEIVCAQVWTSLTVDEKPAGTRLPDIKKPDTP